MYPPKKNAAPAKKMKATAVVKALRTPKTHVQETDKDEIAEGSSEKGSY